MGNESDTPSASASIFYILSARIGSLSAEERSPPLEGSYTLAPRQLQAAYADQYYYGWRSESEKIAQCLLGLSSPSEVLRSWVMGFLPFSTMSQGMCG